jgi:hypothetical protein
VAVEHLLQRLAEIAQRMPAVRHLLGVGNASCDALNLHASPIPADDLDTLVRTEPLGESVAGALFEEVDDVMPFQIHQNRAIALALFPGPIVHASTRTGGLVAGETAFVAGRRLEEDVGT